jgi:hypothetical protein
MVDVPGRAVLSWDDPHPAPTSPRILPVSHTAPRRLCAAGPGHRREPARPPLGGRGEPASGFPPAGVERLKRARGTRSGSEPLRWQTTLRIVADRSPIRSPPRCCAIGRVAEHVADSVAPEHGRKPRQIKAVVAVAIGAGKWKQAVAGEVAAGYCPRPRWRFAPAFARGCSCGGEHRLASSAHSRGSPAPPLPLDRNVGSPPRSASPAPDPLFEAEHFGLRVEPQANQKLRRE